MCVASEETHWKKSCDGKLLFIFFPNTIAKEETSLEGAS